MPVDVISALNLDTECPRGHVCVIKEIASCESSFIASSVLAHQAKKKCATVFVTLHQLLDHYHNIGLRIGVNLKNQQTSGLLKVISPCEIFLKNLFGDCNENVLLCVEKLILETTQDLITQYGERGPVCIYIDGLTHLFDLGFSLKNVNQFSRSIIQRVWEDNCYALLSCAVMSSEDETATIAGLLSHMSDVVVECKSLPSGRSADVSGHLTVKYPGARFKPETEHLLCVPSTMYHFRLFDRGVKLFAPGIIR